MSKITKELGKLRRRIIGGGSAPATTTQSTSSNWLRGVWVPNPTSPYMTYDGVILQTGTATGTYVSTIDANANSPDSGIGWIQIATTQGNWL